jgi:hypothetical protein
MQDLPEKWRDDDYVKQLMRHAVPIHFEFRKDGDAEGIVITSFVFSVEGGWILMTAGHCIEKIKRYREAGFELHRAALLDSMGSKAIDEHPVPFDYDGSHSAALWRDPMYDYGVMIPSNNEQALTRKNGVIPFAENAWKRKLRRVDRYKFLGIPEARVETTGPNTKRLTAMLPTVDRITPEEALEEGFPETTAPMFYGCLREDPLTSLKGMSGGPILAFADGKDGAVERYQLVAMQVSAVRNKYISGVMMQPLGEFLRARIHQSRA